MNSLIEELNKEHIEINESIVKISKLIEVRDFRDSIEKLADEIEKFISIISIHHKKEEEIIYKFLTEQNKSSDKELIAQIVSDHRFLEQLSKEVLVLLIRVIHNLEPLMCGAIGADISFIFNKYKHHAEVEDKFIFQIYEKLHC